MEELMIGLCQGGEGVSQMINAFSSIMDYSGPLLDANIAPYQYTEF